MSRIYVATSLSNPHLSPQAFEKEEDAETFVEQAEHVGEKWAYNIVDTHADYPYKLVEYIKGKVELRSVRTFGSFCNKVKYGKAYCWEHSYINRYLNEGQTCDIWYHPQNVNLFSYQKRGRQTIDVIAKDEAHFVQLVRELEFQQMKYLISDYANFKGHLYDIGQKVKACCRR